MKTRNFNGEISGELTVEESLRSRAPGLIYASLLTHETNSYGYGYLTARQARKLALKLLTLADQADAATTDAP